MNEREVERLVGTYLLVDLKEAEEALINGKEIGIKVAGDTLGEKLSYITAASWIVMKIRDRKLDFKTAFEAYQEIVKQR